MGRWTQYDEDDYRLPEGFRNIGYDADEQLYYFKDAEGDIWNCPDRYGKMLPVKKTLTKLPLEEEDQFFADEDDGDNDDDEDGVEEETLFSDDGTLVPDSVTSHSRKSSVASTNCQARDPFDFVPRAAVASAEPPPPTGNNTFRNLSRLVQGAAAFTSAGLKRGADLALSAVEPDSEKDWITSDSITKGKSNSTPPRRAFSLRNPPGKRSSGSSSKSSHATATKEKLGIRRAFSVRTPSNKAVPPSPVIADSKRLHRSATHTHPAELITKANGGALEETLPIMEKSIQRVATHSHAPKKNAKKPQPPSPVAKSEEPSSHISASSRPSPSSKPNSRPSQPSTSISTSSFSQTSGKASVKREKTSSSSSSPAVDAAGKPEKRPLAREMTVAVNNHGDKVHSKFKESI